METCTQGHIPPGSLATTTSTHPPALPHAESRAGYQSKKRTYSVFIEPFGQPSSYHTFTAPHRPPLSHEHHQHNPHTPTDSLSYHPVVTSPGYATDTQLSGPLTVTSSSPSPAFPFQSVTYSPSHQQHQHQQHQQEPSTPIPHSTTFHLPPTPIFPGQTNALSPVISPILTSPPGSYIFQSPPGSFPVHVPAPQELPNMTRHHHYPAPQPQLTQPGGPHQQPGDCDLSQVTSDPPPSMGFGEPYTCHDNVLPPHYWAQPPQPMQTYPVPTGPVPAPIDAGPTAGMESTQNWDSTCSPSPNAVEDGDDDDHNGPICDANESTEPKKKTRGKFTAEQRQKTAGTRKLKACIRCRMQRVRCIFDPNEPEGVCVTCKNVSKDSKKVIHRVPCLRYKLTETRMFRQGGLKLTRRWEAPQMRDITGWDNDDVRTIHITLGICDEPLVLNVRRFSPRDGDVLHRNWVDGPVKKRKDLEPYALANIVAASDAFTSYLDRNAIPGIEKCVRSSDERIRNTYLMAIRHFRMLSDKDSEKNENPEKLLMANLLRFVFAIRHTTGSSWICGDETLGMEPEIKDQSYPLYGKVSIPRMIIAQFDNFNCLKHLQPLEKKVFPKLEEFIGSNKPKYFFTVYLATFIFCHEVAIQCEDRYRHARQNSLSERYSIPTFVHELQHSANIMLAYWHYYKKDLDPLSMDWRHREKTPLNGLTADQVVFIIQSFEIARDKADELRIIKETNMWEHPLYFVAQMYEKDWTPRGIYNK